jgi:short-subunit dehydrogenase
MRNKKVLIVGATSGIGRSLATLYNRSGCTLGITGRRGQLLEELQHQLPGPVFTESFDVTGTENIRHIETLVEKMGGLDLLIYNSGYGEVSESLNRDIDKRIIETNVSGFAEIVNWAFNYFQKQGFGHIAATSSVGSNRGTAYAPAYSASKAFMSNYMEGLYMKASKHKINVSITDIQPGFVDTKEVKNKRFWVIPVDRCVQQMYTAIEKKKFRVYVSKRWRLVVWLMRIMPISVYKRIG